MIGIAAPSYDPVGAVVVPTRASNPYGAERRTAVTATLDGGASVYDGGYSISDQILEASLARPRAALLATLRYLIALYPRLIVSTETGSYEALVSMRVSGSRLLLSIRTLVELS